MKIKARRKGKSGNVRSLLVVPCNRLAEITGRNQKILTRRSVPPSLARSPQKIPRGSGIGPRRPVSGRVSVLHFKCRRAVKFDADEHRIASIAATLASTRKGRREASGQR